MTPASEVEELAVARLETVSRRRLLAATAVGAAASIWPDARSESAEPDAEHLAAGAIDSHSHVWTTDTERYPLAAGYRRDEMRPASFTADELLSHARPAGVSRVVLIQMSFYGFDNRYLTDCLAAYPGVFSGVAVVDDEAANPVPEMRRLAALGVRGFRIYPRNRSVERWLTAAGAEAMWRAGAEHGLAMCCLVNPDALPAIDAMCQRFPDTPVVIDHMSRIGVDGQLRAAEVDALCRLARHRQTYVKVSAFYALGSKRPPYADLVPMVRRLCEAFGPRRLMWGTDCPYQVQEQTYADSLALVRDGLTFLSDSERQAIWRETAEQVFFAGQS